jgi:hypothetical protein
MTPTLQFTLIPTGPSPAPQPVINAVIGAGDLGTERVELKLDSGGEVSLLNWQIKDENGNVFTFPQLTLHGGGQVSVYTKAGQTSVNALYWNLAQAVWQSGETVILVDAEGKVRATYKIPEG